jgi:hypothetical protein
MSVKTRFVTTLTAIIALALVVSALRVWSQASSLADGFTRPEVEAWGIRSAAIALAAAAQALVLMVVLKRRVRDDGNTLLPPIQRRDRLSRFLGISAGAVSGIALVSAVALGLAGR